MSSCVLDASALLVLMYDEPGSEFVANFVDAGAAISAVNVAEVATKLYDGGQSGEAVETLINALQLEIVQFDHVLAYQTGALRPLTKPWGLSLGDRACLALAQQRGLPVLTADQVWARLPLGLTIHVVR